MALFSSRTERQVRKVRYFKMKALVFYTSCTLTKSLPIPKTLSVETLSQRTIAARSRAWCSRIEAWKGEHRPARDLYCGGHWTIVRALASSLSNFTPFVISAGYGLIGMDTSLAPYAATFAFGQHDSIARCAGNVAVQENRDWWAALCAWSIENMRHCQSLRESAAKAPDAIHMFALSPRYLDAISVDLVKAREVLRNPRNLIIISHGLKRHGVLNENIVSPAADIQNVVGGGLVSLNVSVAAKVIHSIPRDNLTIDKARVFIDQLKATTTPRVYPIRRSVSDAQVVQFIIKELVKRKTTTSYSGLLSKFRASGKACEMKRFRQLYQQLTSK